MNITELETFFGKLPNEKRFNRVSENNHFQEEMNVVLKAKTILEAQDMLENYNPFFRFLAKYFLRIQPGYFRILSDFELEVGKGEKTMKESGTTLHEIVIFKPIHEDSV